MDKICLIADILGAVQESNGRFGRTWWRGQPADKPLVPRAYRDNRTHRMEWLQATQFRQKAATRHGNVPAEDDRVGWLFLMQHYGLPTRVLDWTESPLIATYFVVKQVDGEDACLWALSPEYLNANQIDKPEPVYPEEIDFEASFRREEREAPCNKKVVAVLTTETNVRMLQQQSVVTIHNTATPMETLDPKSHFLACYRIPAAAKEDLRKVLVNLGIRESSLFPDLDHLAIDLWEFNPVEATAVQQQAPHMIRRPS